MWISAAWNWFVNEGGVRDILGIVVGAVATPLLAFKPIRKHFANQRKTADLLDTTTPGGLTDVVAALRGSEGNAGDAAGNVGMGPGGDSGGS